ncbi:hypothetical protein FNV43_RR08701 [Rhamnella rubrinervis]|uniref:Alpha-L-fucosidase n=1 Tax=Rhamnella rubrinervis TaxID=2594499 RepID=A0A8K0H9E2_9ROSA|nr:hypothetical protein FNV43_RR08701 [Rhamnella rubrinervis]
MDYFFESWFSLVHQLQPRAVIFSDVGPDNRWIGDESSVDGSTCWSLFNRSAAKIGDTDLYKYDVSIRLDWFWHASEIPKSARTLLDLYNKSFSRNCLLLLNVPSNSSGLISAEDIQVLQEF